MYWHFEKVNPSTTVQEGEAFKGKGTENLISYVTAIGFNIF
jgi:hypothetical protein